MLKLARGLLDRGYAVDILLVRSGGVLAALIPEQAAVFELNRTRVATAIPKLARYLRDHRPDWLISALTHVNLAAILARLVSGTGVRLIVTEHTQISRRARTAANLSARLTYALTPILYRSADRIVAVARPVVHSRHRAGVQRLQEERSDSGDEGAHPRVHDPRRRVFGEVSRIVALREREHVGRSAVGMPGDCCQQSCPQRLGHRLVRFSAS